MRDHIIYEADTEYGHYQVVDMRYGGRKARVLFSGNRQAAQSGIAYDDKPELLFDYNQRFLELGLGVQPRHVLVIGGGVFTLPMALCKMLPDASIDVVEIDGALPAIAREYFGLLPNPRLTITTGNGRSYIEKTDKLYDLIILDAFTQTSIPSELRDTLTLKHCKRSLTDKGLLAVNIISSALGSYATPLRDFMDMSERLFDKTTVFPAGFGLSLWLPQNFVLVAQKDTMPDIAGYLRYAPFVATNDY